jgi:hypothetical protein
VNAQPSKRPRQERNLDELIARRATLIAAIWAAHPGLSETRLTRLDDGTFTDVWRWDSAEQMQAALANMASFPEAPAAMALARDRTAVDGEIIDSGRRAPPVPSQTIRSVPQPAD